MKSKTAEEIERAIQASFPDTLAKANLVFSMGMLNTSPMKMTTNFTEVVRGRIEFHVGFLYQNTHDLEGILMNLNKTYQNAHVREQE